MEDNLFGGISSFLKTNNNAQGGVSLDDLEGDNFNESPDVNNEPDDLGEEVGKEKKGEETPEIGFTLEELENAEDDQEEEVLESDTDKEVTETKDTKTVKDAETTEGGDEIWKDLSVLFKDKGILEEDFNSEEQMIEVFGKQVNKGVNEWIDNLPEEVKSIVEAASEGLNGKSLTSFIESRDNELSLEGIEDSAIESNDDLAKDIVRAHLQNTTKYSPEKIEKTISRLEDLGELADEAKEAKGVLLELERENQAAIKQKAEQDRRDAAKANSDMINKIKSTIDSTKEIIPGVKLSEKEQKELLRMVTTPVEMRGQTPISASMQLREKDPIDFEMKLNYLIKIGAFNGNFEVFDKKANTKAASKLESNIAASAAKLLAKTVSSNRVETDPDKKSTLADAWKTRKR